MLIRPAVLPDEMDRSYLGRVMRLNGLRDKQTTLRALRVWAGLPADGGDGLRTGTVELLSQLAGLPLDVFVARHTTLPWRRAISPHKTHIDHGGEQSASIISISGIRLARIGAYFCLECVSKDQTGPGFSYWRRAHQLPGCFVCPKHGTPLTKVVDEWAFLKAPAAFIDHTSAHNATDDGWKEHPLVQRFNGIASALMERTQPIDTAVLRQVLHRRGQERNLQVCGDEVRRPLLSDLIRRSFPAAWLRDVFPVALTKGKGQLLNQLDGVFYFAKGASSVEAYFLAMAVLFKSVDEAKETIHQYEARPAGRATRSASEVPDVAKLLSAYIETKGRISGVAKNCGASVFVTSRRLAELGLPSLSTRSRSANLLTAAKAFYVDQRGLIESAALGGIDVTTLETLVRQSSSMLVHALRAMDTAENDASLAA